MRFLDVSRIRVRLDERVTAGDGTELSVDLYLPASPGRYPILLTRNATDNNRTGRLAPGSIQPLPAPADRWKAIAAQGYIVATADVRGRGDSDGVFLPFSAEGKDGAETVAWLHTHPESNGTVAMFGSGYAAFCAWAAAAEGAALAAIASISPFGAVGDGLLHRGGAVRLDWLFWMHLIGGRSLQPANVPAWARIFRHLPLSAQDQALGREDIWWQDWLRHLETKDGYWEPLDLAKKLGKLKLPGLHVSGWWDGQLGAARYYYQAMKADRSRQRLLIGPWDTASLRHPALSLGGFDFGPTSVLDLDEEMLKFFGEYLKGEKPARRPPRARLFATGRNEWVNTVGWPAAVRIRNWNLQSEGAANTRRGDGALRPDGADEAVDAVTHNPAKPVEFQPMFSSFAIGANPLGFTLDQGHITARDEALVYTSEPLGETVTANGRPTISLTVKAEAEDADLFVLLSDCFPHGTRDLHLSHGAIRLKTLKGFEPGRPLAVHLELDELLHDFLPGHSIRVTVTPSLFPLYARNLQGGDYVDGVHPRTAEIELLHGAAHESCLKLPVQG